MIRNSLEQFIPSLKERVFLLDHNKDKIVDGGLIIDIPSKVASVNVEYDDGFITIAIYDFVSNTLLYRDTIDTRGEEEEE